MSLDAKLKWNDYLENQEKIESRRNPEEMPLLTDAELWWEAGQRGHWLRLFKINKDPYQNYLQAYLTGPIHNLKDLQTISQFCQQQSLTTRAIGTHQTILICYSTHKTKVCKIIIPLSDIPRLLEEGTIRSNNRPLKNLPVKFHLFKVSKRKKTKSKSKDGWAGEKPIKLPTRKNKKKR